MSRLNFPNRLRGFSLLEVMIAVVVLATGLLALAALQGSLTRSSAEAKVRGRVATMLSARMDELRSGGYGSVLTTAPVVSTTGDCDTASADDTDWIDCTRIQAGLSELTSTQTVSYWSGGATFSEAATVPTDPDEAQFMRVNLIATWTDASAGSHQLALASDISSLGLTNNLIPPPDDSSSIGTDGPTVRTTSPATAGVIPIALGNGDSSAASNPTPELVGSNNNEKIVGTRFNVLTYTPEGSAAIIQKRFETEVVKCSCQYGAGGTNLGAIYQTAQWPAVWTGDYYELYESSSAAAAPGQTLSSGPTSGVDQSPLCQECCRDHHDSVSATAGRFDPERSDNLVTKYNLNGSGALVQVTPSSADKTYLDSCRVIRVGGFWRTASDMYSRQFGLLETETVSGAEAKSGLPTTAATDAYTLFVKNYVLGYEALVATVGTAPTDAQTKFDATAGINVPDVVDIAAASTSDYRYLHGRGLYIDYLEEKARTRLKDVLGETAAGGRCDQTTSPAKAKADCILPYLPFTSVNLTEIADWAASDKNTLVVNSGNLLATNPAQPSGSRSYGKKNGTSDNTGTVRVSNSGVAINTAATFAKVAGVDPTDQSVTVSDVQAFQVGDSGSDPGTGGTGDEFYVTITGGGLNPYVFYTVPTAGSDTGECVKLFDGTRPCTTNSTLPLSGSILLKNYWVETMTNKSITAQCYDGANLYAVTDTIQVPTFRNYKVSSAVIGSTGATIDASVNDGTKLETTTVSFASIAANNVVAITLAEETAISPTYATVNSGSCETNGGHNKIYLNDPVTSWAKPWEQP